MNIYFVNRKSKLNGPFDVLGTNREGLLRIGDVCIREDNNYLNILIIVSNDNRWNACRLVCRSEGHLGLCGNSMLFSFEGLNKRTGSIKELGRICSMFVEDSIKLFFLNAIEILSYKRDLWDVSVLSSLLSCSPRVISHEVSNSSSVASHQKLSKFEDFLSPNSKKLFNDLQSLGKTLRETYEIIRNTYGADFRKSLKLFQMENPQASIYDK